MDHNDNEDELLDDIHHFDTLEVYDHESLGI